MTDAAGAADVSVARTPPAVLEYPSTFEATQHPEADLVLRHRSRPAGFRPNLVLTSVETPASLTDASMVAMRAATVQHPGAQLISCDTWDAADAESTPRARRIRFAYHADDRLDVLVSKWVWATGHHHVHLSASCLPSQAGEFEPVFAWVAARLRPTAPPADVLRAAESVGEAAIEGTLTETVGFPLEDLRQLDPVRFRSRGPLVSDAALRMLGTAASRYRIGAPLGGLSRSDRNASDAALLRTAGWIDDRSRVTELGSATAEALTANRHVLTVQMRRAARTSTLHVYAGMRGALVVHAPSLAEATGGEGLRHALFVSPEQVPGLVAAWIGVGPAWAVSDPDGETIPSAQLARHLDAAVADGAPEPWTELLIRDARGDRYGAISPSRGFLRIGPPDGAGHTVRADPTSALFDHLLSACDRAFGV